MQDIEGEPEWPGDMSAKVWLCKSDGSELPVRLRLLGFNGCEFECSHPLERGEQIKLHLYRMGWIRARVLNRHGGLFEAEFDHECPA